MLKTKSASLFLTFSLPTAETKFATVSAAVEQLTVFSVEAGGDWQVRFQGVDDQVWIPHPMSPDGISLPCPTGCSTAVYRRIDVSDRPQGWLYPPEEVLKFSGYWQKWLPELTVHPPAQHTPPCHFPKLSQSLMQDTTTGTKSWLRGFFAKCSGRA
jgi:hypothetical protein